MRQEFQPQSSFVAERRGAARSRVAGEARLQTPGGDWKGLLWDLSETGARVQVQNPPSAGATALLKWESNEWFCKVVWTIGEMCGVVFERPIAAALVRNAPTERTGPRPSLSNIPLGQRRSRPA
jgi:hypothetical protein